MELMVIIEVLAISCHVQCDDITNNDVIIYRGVYSTSDNLFKLCCLTAYKTVVWMMLIGAYTPDICFVMIFSAQFTMSGQPTADISPSAHGSAGDHISDEFF